MLRVTRNAVMDKLASAMPGGCKPQSLLVQVSKDKEALVGYTNASDKRRSQRREHQDTAAPSSLEMALRVPLRLTCVARAGDCAVSIEPSCEENHDRLRGVLRDSPFEYFSTLKECDRMPASLILECDSSEGALRLMDKLQAAGCIMKGIHQRFKLGNIFAKGSFGVVFMAEDLRTGEHLAVKIFTKDYTNKLIHPLMEACILREYTHSNILQFRGLFEVSDQELLDEIQCESPTAYAIATEYLDGGELLKFIQWAGKAKEDQARRIMRQLIQSIAVLHRGGIAHRDIKPENIVLNGPGCDIKLIDFGLAACQEDEEAMLMKAGSPGYAAPEVLCNPQSCKSDCFSVGVIMFILLCGRAPFPGRDANEVLKRNMRCQLAPGALDDVSPLARELILGLLQKHPERRLSAEEALRHSWFHRPREATSVVPMPPLDPPCQRARHLPGLRKRVARNCVQEPQTAREPQQRNEVPDFLREQLRAALPEKTAAQALRERVAAAQAAAAELEQRLSDIGPSPRVSLDVSRNHHISPGDAAANAVCIALDTERPSNLRRNAQAASAFGSTVSAAARVRGEEVELDGAENDTGDASRAPSVERFTIGAGGLGAHEVRSGAGSGSSSGESVSQGPVSSWAKQHRAERVMAQQFESDQLAGLERRSGFSNAERPSNLERPSFLQRPTLERERRTIDKDTSAVLIKKVMRAKPQRQLDTGQGGLLALAPPLGGGGMRLQMANQLQADRPQLPGNRPRRRQLDPVAATATTQAP